MANNRHILEDLFKAAMQLLNQIEDQSENEEATTRAITACLLDYRIEIKPMKISEPGFYEFTGMKSAKRPSKDTDWQMEIPINLTWGDIWQLIHGSWRSHVIVSPHKNNPMAVRVGIGRWKTGHSTPGWFKQPEDFLLEGETW